LEIDPVDSEIGKPPLRHVSDKSSAGNACPDLERDSP
jgi:hypothetical protein